MTRKVFVVSEVRMHRDSHGAVRAKHPAAAYDNWMPFRDVMGDVTVLARLDESTPDDSGVLVEGEGVTVRGLPYYVGAKGLITGFWRVRTAMRRAFTAQDLVVLRLPELTSIAAWAHARRATVVSIVVADAAGFARLSLPRALGWTAVIARKIIAGIVRRSDAVVYVSEHSLQALYPARSDVPTMARSNVRVPETWLTGGRSDPEAAPFTVVTVGALAATTKGVDVLLGAMAGLSGRPAKVVIVGDGQLRDSYIEMAASLGVDAEFVGQVDDREDLARLLDHSDIYVCASRTEGLSRAMVEAMARGLPVVSTDVGAARELLADPETIVPSEDVAALRRAVERMRDDVDVWRTNSAANAARAREVISAADPLLLTTFLQGVGQQR